MATAAQIAANRRNALKSSGPRTAEGKAASRIHAFKSGICQIPHIRGQDPTELEALGDDSTPLTGLTSPTNAPSSTSSPVNRPSPPPQMCRPTLGVRPSPSWTRS
jgi:hypothetical protein